MYRWHHSPGRPLKHLWGMERYTIGGMDISHGDSNPDLAEMTVKYGCLSWEINASYLKMHGHTAYLWPEWYRCDPSLADDGSRTTPFPGWDGEHPWLRASEPNTAYESRYFFCPTYRGNGKNKRLHKERGAGYVKNLKWEKRRL
jgi:hypothetical protein